MRTYYVHIDQDGAPCGPRAKYLGSALYGYSTLRHAIRNCPAGAQVVSRYQDHRDDGAGEVLHTQPADWVRPKVGRACAPSENSLVQSLLG